MPDRAAPDPGRGTSTLALLPGVLWGLTLFVAFDFVITPRPETAAQVAILLFLALFVGAVSLRPVRHGRRS